MILVTGATGTIGRHLVATLMEAGADVRAVTRNPDAEGLVVGDPSRPATLATALEGVSALFLHPRAVGEAATELVALAKQHGVTRVVAMAASNVDDDVAHQPSRYRGDRNKEAEEAVVGSGLEWVSLRPCSFMSNAFGLWGEQVRNSDVVRGVYADFAEALVDERDIAEVAARALLTDELVGTRPELTGPQSLTHAEMVMIMGEALGKRVTYAEVPAEAAKEGMIQRGLPEPFVSALMDRYARGVGQPAHTTGEVEKILGRPARTFAEWAADALRP